MHSNRDEIVELIKNYPDKLLVVDFFAKWCGPCKIISPYIEKLESDYNNNIFVRKIDVDKEPEFSQECNVGGMPTFLFFKNMKQVGKVVGADLDQIHRIIEANI